MVCGGGWGAVGGGGVGSGVEVALICGTGAGFAVGVGTWVGITTIASPWGKSCGISVVCSMTIGVTGVI